MDANFWAIIGVGIVLLGTILVGQRSLRNEISALRKRLDDVHGQLHDGLAAVRQELNDGLASVRQELADVRERLAAIEGVLGMRQAINPKDKDQPRQPRRPAAEDRPDRRPQP